MSAIHALTDHTDKNVVNLIPLIDLDTKSGCVVRKNKELLAIYQITTKDFNATTESDIEYDVFSFAKFYRLYSDDLKIVAMNFPVDTKEQRRYFQRKLQQTNNEVFKYHLRVRFDQLEYIEKNMLDKEFYLFVYAKDKEDLKEKRSSVNAVLVNNGLAEEIESQKKEQILFKLCNKNTSIFD